LTILLCIAGNFLSIRWRILNFNIFNFYFKIFNNIVFRRFSHLAVLVIDKYRYGKNIFPRDVKLCPVRGELFVIVYVLHSCWFLWPGPHTTFSPYGNRLKKNVDTLSADFPYEDKILRRGENILAVTVLVNDKYFKMHGAAKHSLFKF
jgi:hypothetical protein